MKKNFTLLWLVLTQLTIAQSINITPFATGFTNPTDISHPVNDARLFVVQQSGAIKIVNPNGTVNATNFLTLTSATITSGGERGLLGLAFHPNYATNGYFYVNYTRAGNGNDLGDTVIARYQVSADPNVANPTSGTVLMVIDQPFSNHNGGSLKFGSDGYLYIGMGDGGSGGDPGNRAQNINDNLGKMLRIDVDSASPYGIPADNPFVGVAGNDEIWAIGLRNPWKFNFDRLNGDLWIADVGQNQFEEINHVTAPLAPGLNYGWKCYEGNGIYSSCSGTLNFTFPVAQYAHGGVGVFCNSITGGYVYRGTQYPNMFGKYLFAEYCTDKIGYINDAGNIVWSNTFSNLTPTTFGEDINGELYVAGGNTLYKIVDTSLSNNSYDKETFSIYPNPASSEIFLKTKGLQFPATALVVDTTGKTVLQQEISADNSSLSIAQLPSGLYIVTLKDQTGVNISSKLTVR
jgi:glucose/arabinose dehydrogenase